MEDIGAEVSLKIRSAIKAKLVELGAYVDDELPDYIMVMVANKRSKTQMDNDLKLFLGANTFNFTGWLHTVLQKLQEVTIASNLHKQNALPVIPEKPPLKSAKVTSPVEGEDHKHKHKKKQKKSSESSSRKKSSTESKKAFKVVEEKATELTETLDSLNSSKVQDIDKIRTSSNGKSKESSKTSKKVLTKSIFLLEADIEAKQKPANLNLIDNKTIVSPKSVSPEYLLDTELAKKEVEGTRLPLLPTETSPLKVRKPVVMQSDEEDFEDIINIKDTEMMDFLDAELPEELPKVTRTILVSPKAASSHANPTVAITLGRDPEMEVDDLEEQRSKLLRDLKRLEKPVKTARPTIDKYSVVKLFDRHGKTSALSRLGAIVKVIDPDEFNIAGPPKEAEPTKLRMADRLGKKTTVECEKTESILIKNVKSGVRNVALESKVVGRDSSKDDSRRNVLDRLGKKKSSDSDDTEDDLYEKPGNSSRKEKSVSATLVPKETERKVNVLNRLGMRASNSSCNERPKRTLENESSKSKLADRLGKKRSSSRERPSSGRSYQQRDKRASEERDKFNSRFMDRREEAVKKETALTREPERVTIMDRLGKKVTRDRGEGADCDATSKRPTRIISIKEALAGELQHSSGKRASTNTEEKEREELPRKRLLLSRVVAVKRDPRQNDETGPDVAIASVIRVQPRPKVPAAMQANKNLLLKAMAEAHKSVAAAPVRQEPKAELANKACLYTRKYRAGNVEKINLTIANPKQALSYVEDDEDVELVNEEREDLANITRTVANVSQQLRKAAEEEEELKREWQRKAVIKTNIEKTNSIQGEAMEVSSPPVDNEEDEVLEEIYEEDEGDSIVGNVSPLGDTQSKVLYSGDYSAGEEPELQQNYNIKSRSTRGGNTQFVVTLDGLDPLTLFNSRKRNVEQQHTERPASPLPVPEHESRIHSWLLSLDRAKEEKVAPPVAYKKARLASTVEVPMVPKAAMSTTERCKYWPACRQGEHCEFVHPATTCKAFPSCKFGDKCLYVHPNCKFDTSCTRRECPYTHAGVGPVTAVLPLSRPRNTLAQPVCKFYPKCSNVNCAFQHPMPCRFGRSCTKSDCVFFHEEIPSTEKLKWVKTN